VRVEPPHHSDLIIGGGPFVLSLVAWTLPQPARVCLSAFGTMIVFTYAYWQVKEYRWRRRQRVGR
jgi:hypothetical protein